MSFRINRVYTRSGDSGETSLVGGARVSKSADRVEAYGEIDELNCVLGLIQSKLNADLDQIKPVLLRVQQELFDLGSELATPAGADYPGMWRCTDADVKRLEELCDRFGASLPELLSFVLPGGNEVASLIHLARVQCRRAERVVVKLNETAPKATPEVSLAVLAYINRLSDLLFILARYVVLASGENEVLWVKASERGEN